jgi:hypothetical protein
MVSEQENETTPVAVAFLFDPLERDRSQEKCVFNEVGLGSEHLEREEPETCANSGETTKPS